MRDEIAARLLHLNQQFYQTFAQHFAETRRRLQPGVIRILDNLPPQMSVLDLGCGNGELALGLARHGHNGIYLGLDASGVLLSIACQKCEHPRARFQQVNLADPAWVETLPAPSQGEIKRSYDRILAFAVLHHLPGRSLRLNFVHQIHDLLIDNGQFILSNWNFMASPRLRGRIVSWEAIGLSQAEVEPGDHLLDWRRGGIGLRYVHHFNEEELLGLATEAGYRIIETFYSDGEGGRLGLYQVWEKVWPSNSPSPDCSCRL